MIQLRCGQHGLRAVCLSCERDVDRITRSVVELGMPVGLTMTGLTISLSLYPAALGSFIVEHQGCNPEVEP